MEPQDRKEAEKWAAAAAVHKDGIHYLGRRYTQALAVREQWFGHAAAAGPREIEVFVEPGSQKLYLHTSDGFVLLHEAENREEDPELDAKRQQYALLKERWLELRKGNNRGIYFPGKRTNR